MGQKAKWEYFRAIYERYRQANRKRKHAIRPLNGPPSGLGSARHGPQPAIRDKTASRLLRSSRGPFIDTLAKSSC
jgi:hypothetical protein